MIITDYYRFEKSPGKSATRYDCTASTESHPELEVQKNKQGQLFCYFTDVPLQFRGDIKRKADKNLTTRQGKNLSSLFVPNVSLSLAYGDIKNTTDAILLRFEPDFGDRPTAFELFVCRGQRNNRLNLYQLFAEGEFAAEIEQIKQKITGA